MTVTCPACGSGVVAGRFCTACGSPLPGGAPGGGGSETPPTGATAAAATSTGTSAGGDREKAGGSAGDREHAGSSAGDGDRDAQGSPAPARRDPHPRHRRDPGPPASGAARVVACHRCGAVNAASRTRCARCRTDLRAEPDAAGASGPGAGTTAGASAGGGARAAGPAASGAAAAGTAASGAAAAARGGGRGVGAGAPSGAVALPGAGRGGPRPGRGSGSRARRRRPPSDEPPLPGVLLLAVSVAAVAVLAVGLTLLSARGVGPFAGPAADATQPAGTRQVEVVAARASSTVPAEDARSYGPDNLVDGDPTTVWNEGSPGDGVGEWVDLQLAERAPVQRLLIRNGFQAEGFFQAHNRVRTLQLALDDRRFTVGLLDRGGVQAIALPEPVEAEEIRLTIAAVYPGDRYNDAALSEVTVLGAAPGASAQDTPGP